MSVLRYYTAGESHGPAVLAYVDGMPAGIKIDRHLMNVELRRRQGGYGRSERQQIERDEANIRSGVRGDVSIGSPIVIEIANRDERIDTAPAVHQPRPGHADFAGCIKWLTTDSRSVLERASARETAGRVAAGAVAKCFLRRFGIVVVGFVQQIGKTRCHIEPLIDLNRLQFERDESEVYCPDARATESIIREIDAAHQDGDTLGGVIEVRAQGVPPGLGSCMQWDQRLDGRLMQAVGSIQAIKGVEIGSGFSVGNKRGSEVHDELEYDVNLREAETLGYIRKTNHAGGLEGGMTNGQTLVVRAAMKPISTLSRGLQTVDMQTKAPAQSAYERSDVCAVPAASVVAENVVAFEIARAFLEKFGGDTIEAVGQCYDWHMLAARNLGLTGG